jgi:L-threonylcarbamoyladenylate synthase
MPAAITAAEVRAQLDDESMSALIDGGSLPSRSGSTVLDITSDPPMVLRDGPVTFEKLADFFKGQLRRQVA